MLWWRIPEAAFLLSVCACVTLAYEDDIEIQYTDYYNEITDGETPAPTPSSTPCNSPDLTKWDKIFSMMENSQMRENMLIQYVDDIVKVEMGSLRGELRRFIAEYEKSCGAAVETAGRRMVLQLEGHLRETLELLKLSDLTSAVGNFNHLEAQIQQLLSAEHTQTSRLAKLESSCLSSRNAGAGFGLNGKNGLHLQEVTPREVALDEVLVAMQALKAELDEELKSSRQRRLPAGCEMALLFPVRSRRIYTAIIPDVPLSLSSFTVCMWVKPTSVFNKTVLFSYGHRRNPSEIQLLLSQTSAVFTVGEEASQVEARSVVSPGQWIHLCGAWSSEQGLAILWVGGEKMASKPGMAKGHNLPEGGSLQLGQERNGCCPLSPASGSGVAGFEGSFDPKLAFAGKMTGVNMWDTVLSEEEISQMAVQRGHGCQHRGSVVAWGVTEIVPHGGAQFIY
ncbi:pentraxin-related protein PTX3 [Poeciliopsis prolifica]|uniref:pentraxin-related protein PTX3 n=1 Tax=Poeciliopsis prolifica TaxID=188132 RepID=UPI002413466F|nr:pentraxin-related protein PTX3 [Poeciliopsis prolifica]